MYIKLGIYCTYNITTYVENYVVGRSRNHCCHLSATSRSLSSVVGVDVAVNNTEEFTVAMELQRWVSSLCTTAELQNISSLC